MMLMLALLALQAPDSAALARATDYAARTGAQAVLVMHRGTIIHERYMAGGSASLRGPLASGSKSFVGLAAVAAAADGKLSLDAPVATYLPTWSSDPRKARITVRQLLSLESGLESGNPGTGCGGPRKGWSDAIAAGTYAEPGTAFRYGPYPFIVGGAVIEQVTGTSFATFLEQRLLQPLGVQVEWAMRCADGKPQLAGGARMTARDWATLGEFLRLGGVHQGKRLLPSALVSELSKPAKVNPAYGLSMWLAAATVQTNPTMGIGAADGAGSGGGGAAGAGRPGRAGGGAMGGVLRRRRQANAGPTAAPAWLPTDLYMAAGMGKQRLYIIPSHNLVVVRMGPILGGREFTDIGFLEALLADAPSRY
ncbi:MAG: beta-lactamase family protein [Gemmatimonadetes bacterium]|nr:beta-lactamase family protein [Gemmatimonadota bacterium]